MPTPLIDTILVAQGAEYQAVCRGLQNVESPPSVLPIPIGTASVQRFLAKQPQLDRRSILVMGLCGSLQPSYPVGTAVLYCSVKAMIDREVGHWLCDAALTQSLQVQLPAVPLVQSWTSEQFVNSRTVKQQLRQTYGVDVVDMEGKAILTTLRTARIATLRVVSDDCQHNLPNLDWAISAEGKLLPLPLVTSLLAHPVSGLRLIHGSLQGLKYLQQLTTILFT